MESTKSKHSRLQHWKKLFITLIGIPLSCYVVLWLFAAIGGQWATQWDIPISDDAEFVTAYTHHDGYIYRNSIYASSSPPEVIREWYVEQGISMTPIDLVTSSISYDGYYANAPTFHRETAISRFHRYLSYILIGWLDANRVKCQGIRIYKTFDYATNDFPEAYLPEGKTIVVISTCWVNVLPK